MQPMNYARRRPGLGALLPAGIAALGLTVVWQFVVAPVLVEWLEPEHYESGYPSTTATLETVTFASDGGVVVRRIDERRRPTASYRVLGAGAVPWSAALLLSEGHLAPAARPPREVLAWSQRVTELGHGQLVRLGDRGERGYVTPPSFGGGRILAQPRVIETGIYFRGPEPTQPLLLHDAGGVWQAAGKEGLKQVVRGRFRSVIVRSDPEATTGSERIFDVPLACPVCRQRIFSHVFARTDDALIWYHDTQHAAARLSIPPELRERDFRFRRFADGRWVLRRVERPPYDETLLAWLTPQGRVERLQRVATRGRVEVVEPPRRERSFDALHSPNLAALAMLSFRHAARAAMRQTYRYGLRSGSARLPLVAQAAAKPWQPSRRDGVLLLGLLGALGIGLTQLRHRRPYTPAWLAFGLLFGPIGWLIYALQQRGERPFHEPAGRPEVWDTEIHG